MRVLRRPRNVLTSGLVLFAAVALLGPGLRARITGGPSPASAIGVSARVGHPVQAPDVVVPALLRVVVSGATAEPRPAPGSSIVLALLVGLLLAATGARRRLPAAALSSQRRSRCCADTAMRGPPSFAP